MSSLSTLDKIKRISFEMETLAIAVVAFTLSSLYVQNTVIKLSFVLFPQVTFYAVFGFFHAYNVLNLDNVVSGKKQNGFMLFCYFLVYTAWYNIILLPESGLGYIEWVIVFFILISNLLNEVLSKPIHNPFMGQRPLVLAFLGVCFFFIKMIFFFMFKDNIYDQQILHNDTARYFVFIFCLLGIIFLFIQLSKNITNKLGIKINKRKAKNFIKASINAIRNLIKTGVKLLASVCSGPVVIIIICVVALGTFGIGFAAVEKIRQDILKFVEPILEKLLSTGENSIHPSIMYYVFQTISMVIVLFFTIRIEKNMEEKIEGKIVERIRSEIDNTENSSKSITNKDLFKDSKKLLVNRKFNDKLMIFGDPSFDYVKETVQELNERNNEE